MLSDGLGEATAPKKPSVALGTKYQSPLPFGQVVRATELTLFCLDDQCVVLTRIWCLYEVSIRYCNTGTGHYIRYGYR